MENFQYQKLANTLRSQIETGLLTAGSKLPSIRALCLQHQVAKNTVIHALQRLEQLGYVEARARQGYFVRAPKTPTTTKPVLPLAHPRPVNIPDVLHDIMRKSAAFDVLPHQAMINTPTGITNLNRHLSRAIKQSGHINSAYYDNPKGNENLREALAQHYIQLGVAVSSEHLCITAGCQQAIALSLQVICNPGDTVVIESPGFYGALQLLEHLGLNVLEVPSDPLTGLDIDLFKAALESHDVTACVVTPSFATPSGALMPEESKKTLVSLAKHYDFAIIEDDIYGEVYFSTRPTPLKFYDDDDRVVLCSSFSKSVSRDLRIGWVMGARWHADIVKSKLVNQLSISQTPQLALNNFIRSGDWRRHLQQQRQRFLHQRDQLMSTIEETWHFPYEVTMPMGGLCCWLTLPKHLDVLHCYHECKDNGITITPGALFTTTQDYNHHIRISFCHPIVGARRKAIERVGDIIHSFLEKRT